MDRACLWFFKGEKKRKGIEDMQLHSPRQKREPIMDKNGLK